MITDLLGVCISEVSDVQFIFTDRWQIQEAERGGEIQIN